ncbi:MAG: ABC transporter permease [Gammaproteobacteria bacterium]|mgnify:CR=1 FL=1|nr:ABC transporter permease [Gammaproteobacteria bacterium]
MQKPSFWAAFKETFHAIFKDEEIILMVILAPILYGFFYPWPYSNQLALQVPAAIIDYDNTDLSRQIYRYAAADPRIAVLRLPSEQAAKEALWHGEIEGYMILPANLKHDVLHNKAGNVAIAGNGSYVLLNKSVLYGFAEAVGTVSAGIAIEQFTAQGMSAEQAYTAAQPLILNTKAYYNVSQGYASYVVPAVALLILQQTLLMGVALYVGTLFEAKKAHARASTWCARILAFCSVSWLIMGFYFGWLFTWMDFARGGNLLGTLLLMLIYAPTAIIWGALLGLWFKVRERSLQVLAFTSLPIYFISGFSWPAEGLPPLMQTLRWLIPSTPAIQASIRLDQMGASISTVTPYLLNIAALGIIGFILLLLVGRKRSTETDK